MRPTDPITTRRRGHRRVRAVTAAVAGTALAGTGVLTVVVAADHPAAAAAETSSATTGTDRVQPSGGLGRAPSSGVPHASSGGS